MTTSDRSRERVLSIWPDAMISTAYAKQLDGSRKWMYCVMSNMKFVASRGKKRVANVGDWQFNECTAWKSASRACPGYEESE